MARRPPFRSVTSRHNPLVAAFREAADRASDETVLIEGARLAFEAVRAGWTMAILATLAEGDSPASDNPALERLLAAVGDQADIVAVSPSVMKAISPAASPSGIVAIARRPQRHTDPFAGDPALVLVACDIQDPGNVGALARTAEAAAASGLLLCGTSASPYGWKALRGSMGSAFRLPIRTYADAGAAFADLRARGLRIFALAAGGAQTVYDAELQGPSALVVGGEGPGLSPATVAATDGAIRIPMCHPVESLNVAVAAAVALYEATRQRSTPISFVKERRP